MNTEFILFIVQIIAAVGVVISVIYLGVQIHQQNEITKASSAPRNNSLTITKLTNKSRPMARAGDH